MYLVKLGSVANNAVCVLSAYFSLAGNNCSEIHKAAAKLPFAQLAEYVAWGKKRVDTMVERPSPHRI